jgi:SAM-dependent methyltransferase
MTLLDRLPSNAMLAVCDRHFAPSVLSPFADDLARRLSRFNNGPLLEIAAGTGVLTQAIASALSAGLTLIATDPAQDIVEHAMQKPGMARVIWQQADPLALPFADATFGIVACLTGVATLASPVQAFKQVRRVLKPGGRFVFSVPGNIRHNPVASCLQAALNDSFPDTPPRFIADGLHGYANNEIIDDDLTEAGFTDAIYTTVELPFAVASARDIAIGYCLGTLVRADLEQRTAGNIEPILHAATLALEQRFGAGVIQSTMRAHVVSAAG